MKLKIKTEKVIELQEWDKFVEKTYGRPYCFQQQDGCVGRGLHRFSVPCEDEPCDFEKDAVPEEVNGPEGGVSFKAWLARDPKQPIKNQRYEWELELWYHRNFYPCFDMIVQDLYNKGLIEKGKYIIEIDW